MENINLITSEEEETLKRIDDDCKKLHVFIPPKAFVNIEVSNKNGVRYKSKSLSKSWVRNAYNLLIKNLMGTPLNDYGSGAYSAGGLAMKDTSGTLHSLDELYINDSSYWAGVNTGLGTDDDYGIVVGTGSTAESFNDYALATKIVDGVSATQLEYLAGTTSMLYDSGNVKWTATHQRSFTNSSGGSITVNETGIIALLKNITSDYYFLVNRDILSPGVAVANGETLTVTYVIETTLPG